MLELLKKHKLKTEVWHISSVVRCFVENCALILLSAWLLVVLVLAFLLICHGTAQVQKMSRIIDTLFVNGQVA